MVHNVLSDATLLDLVEHIYAAGSDPDGWPRFVERVNKAVPGLGIAVGLAFMSESKSGFQSFVSAGYSPESVRSLIDHYQSLNPYESLFAAVPTGRVVRATELV